MVSKGWRLELVGSVVSVLYVVSMSAVAASMVCSVVVTRWTISLGISLEVSVVWVTSESKFGLGDRSEIRGCGDIVVGLGLVGAVGIVVWALCCLGFGWVWYGFWIVGAGVRLTDDGDMSSVVVVLVMIAGWGIGGVVVHICVRVVWSGEPGRGRGRGMIGVLVVVGCVIVVVVNEAGGGITVASSSVSSIVMDSCVEWRDPVSVGS